MRTRFVVVAAIAAVAVCAPAWGAAGGSGAIAASGKVGPLQVDKSVRADVVAFAGKPDAEVQEIVYGFAKYDALGYGCSTKQAANLFTLGNDGPYCVTVFFLDKASKTLEDFVTTSSAYHTSNGVHIGTSLSVAQRAYHTPADRSCLVVLKTETGTASLRINFTGGKADTFAVHSLKRTSGWFQCMA